MKVKVIKAFTDKHTKVKYAEGDIIDVTLKRFNEIIKNPRGELVEKVKKEGE
jgi:hypothetical protein